MWSNTYFSKDIGSYGYKRPKKVLQQDLQEYEEAVLKQDARDLNKYSRKMYKDMGGYVWGKNFYKDMLSHVCERP